MNNKKLIKQIQRLCEKQYRKGLQHGVYYAENNIMDSTEALKFRAKGIAENYKKHINPLNSKPINFHQQLLGEMTMSDMDELQYLFFDNE